MRAVAIALASFVALSTACNDVADMSRLSGGSETSGKPALKKKNQGIKSIDVTPAVDTIGTMDTVRLSAAVMLDDDTEWTGRRFRWTTSDANVATVSQNGLVVAVNPGVATISAWNEGIPGNATIAVRSATAAPAEPVTPPPSTPVTQPVTAPVTTPTPVTPPVTPPVVEPVKTTQPVPPPVSPPVTAPVTQPAPVAVTQPAPVAVAPPAPVGAIGGARPARCGNEPLGFAAQTSRDFATLYGPTTAGRLPGWGTEEEMLRASQRLIDVASAADEPLSPGNTIRYQYPVGLQGGTGPGTAAYMPPAPTHYAYICMSVRYSAGFEGNGMTKLGYVNWPGGSFIIMANGGGTTTPLTLSFPINHGNFYRPDGSQKPNTGNIYTASTFTRGQWAVLEMLFEMSSAPDMPDGRIRAWLDGAPGVDKQGYAYPGTSAPTMGMSELRLHAIWGGGAGPNGCCVTVPGTFDIGHVYVSGK
ncbi:MAG: Ig-like domain-containing protein [Gemmatimonadaceae bacterium]